MPRPLRVDYCGAWHHVMNRGARRAPVFANDEHAGGFLEAVRAMRKRFALEVHAYALMPHHYHLLVRSVRGNLSEAMKHLSGKLTQEINRLHRWDGPVFRGRFRSELIEDQNHLLTVTAYIHLNPIRAGISRRLDQRCWTSHRSYLGLDLAPEWLSWQFVTDLAGGQQAFAYMVADFRVGAKEWPVGFDLKNGMLAQVEVSRRLVIPRPNLRDTNALAPRKLKQLLGEIKKITGAAESELTFSIRGPHGNPARRFAVWVLSRESNLTQEEIGAALKMSVNHVSKTLGRFNNNTRPPVGDWICAWQKRSATVGND